MADLFEMKTEQCRLVGVGDYVWLDSDELIWVSRVVVRSTTTMLYWSRYSVPYSVEYASAKVVRVFRRVEGLVKPEEGPTAVNDRQKFIRRQKFIQNWAAPSSPERKAEMIWDEIHRGDS